jgi:hypothetical protein
MVYRATASKPSTSHATRISSRSSLMSWAFISIRPTRSCILRRREITDPNSGGQPGLPLKRGRCGTMTRDYVRHGTTTPSQPKQEGFPQFGGLAPSFLRSPSPSSSSSAASKKPHSLPRLRQFTTVLPDEAERPSRFGRHGHDIGLTELTKHAILSYPLPDQQSGEKFAAFTYLHSDAQTPVCGTAQKHRFPRDASHLRQQRRSV